MALIQTEKLGKTYRSKAFDVDAVTDIDLHFKQGEFTAIVGPSGSGKTTLLNLLGGLDRPTTGRLLIDGKDIGLLKEKELVDFRLRNIGFVFQSYNLIPVFTVEENISFLMELQGRPKEEQKW
ncbi:ATP-binding cassette domain-containing protein, partial [Bacteroides heparinolyticus]